MIQPISNNINSNFFSYRQNKITNRQLSSASKDNMTQGDDIVYLFNNDKQNDKLNNILSIGFGTIAFGLIAIAASMFLKTSKSYNNSAMKNFTENFKSLAEDSSIPTLDTCKSLNKKLRNFLQKQLKIANTNSGDLKNGGKLKSANRLILCGPPGTGKSYYAKIYAKSLNAEYIEVKYSEINSIWVGRHLEQLSSIFHRTMVEAETNPNKKYVLVLNEIDPLVVPAETLSRGVAHAVFKREERAVFLTCVDELAEKAPNVTIIGTTNMYPKNGALDGAAMSRFKNIMNVDYPEQDCLFEALKDNLKKNSNLEKDFVDKHEKELNTLAEKMTNRKASFRDLNKVIEEANNNFILEEGGSKKTDFQMKYLEDAFDSIEYTDGEISKYAA